MVRSRRLFAAVLAAVLTIAAGSTLAAAAAPTQPIVVQALECRGDDGAWRIEANRTSATFTTQTPRKREIVFRGGLQALGASEVLWRGDSTHLPRETLVLAAREESCKAPATGTHRAILSIRAGDATSGCCTVRAGYDARTAPIANLASKDDWSRALPDLLAAVNACLAREGSRALGVAAASSSGSAVRVRIVEANGAVDCTVDASGRGTPSIAAADATAVTGPRYYPAREQAPIVACGRLERVQVRGSTAGYLHYDPC
ncbi:MAG: hypothetical protein U1F54_06140 [Burkholderiales bacterium]